MQRKAACVTKAVEHATPGGQFAGQVAIVTLVKVEAGLVAGFNIDFKANAMFDNTQALRGKLSVGKPRTGLEPFTTTHLGV